MTQENGRARILLGGAWHEATVGFPPQPWLNVPVLTLSGYGQIRLPLVALENGLAIYGDFAREKEIADEKGDR